MTPWDSSALAYSQGKPQPGWGSWTPQTESSSQKPLHCCGFHRSYKTQRQEGVLPFSGFPSGHPGLKHGFVTEKSELVNRWETARLCPWESQKIGQFAKEFTSWYENHLFPLITGRFSSRQRASMNRFKEWGLGKTPCTHSEQTRSFFFFWQCCAASRILVPQFSSVAQPCQTLFDPTNYSTPGLLVHHQLPEPTQTHVHWVGDAIQPSHHLSSPSPPALNLSQHQGLFKWVSSSHQVAKVLEFQLQHQFFQWTPRTDLL